MGGKVAITGFGLINDFGLDAESIWSNIHDVSNASLQLMNNFDQTKYFDKKEISRLDSFAQYALLATKESLDRAQLVSGHSFEETGVLMGASGNGADKLLLKNHSILLEKGPRRVSPFYSSAAMINSPPAELSIKNKFEGPSGTLVAGETSSLLAIGQSFKYIKTNIAPMMIAGGTQGDISDLTKHGYLNSGIASKTFQHYKPFTSDSKGAPLKEGAGAVVLEELEEANKRNAEVYGELMGFSMNTTGNNLKESYKDVLLKALEEAGIEASQVEFLSLNGSGIPTYDRAEEEAVNEIFDNDITDKLVPKKIFGNLLASNGVTHLIYSLYEMRKRLRKPQTERIIGVIQNFDFQRHNTCLVVKVEMQGEKLWI